MPASFTYLGSAYWLGFPVSAWVTIGVFLVAALFLRYHRTGRAVYAIGGNLEASRAAGIKVDRVRIGVFCVAGALAAVGGLMTAGEVLTVTANQGNNLIFTVFAAAVIGGIELDGGRGRMVGAFTGVVLLGLVNDVLVLRNTSTFWIDAVDRGDHPPRARDRAPRGARPDLTVRLDGKICIVTGAGSGIGRASALLFAEHGATVVAADLDAAAEGVTHRVDVTDETQTLALAAGTVADHGRIDVLFNNAGIAGVGDVEETTLELWEQVMRVNVRGVFLMSRAVVPTMIAQRSGSIINMSSAIAETGLARRVSYAASKGAVYAMTKSMQVDLAPHGVRVNALLPGTIMTPFVEGYLRDSYADPEEGRRAIRSRQLGGELGTAEDVAQAALYLASDESSFVLGSGLVVDGGLSAGKS